MILEIIRTVAMGVALITAAPDAIVTGATAEETQLSVTDVIRTIPAIITALPATIQAAQQQQVPHGSADFYTNQDGVNHQQP